MVYKFNGKEKDEETGMYYYGARYYTPEVSIWMSVDPISDKYPSMSPFMYCAGNPVKYIDPDGMEWEPASRDKAMQIRDNAQKKADRFDRRINRMRDSERRDNLVAKRDELNNLANSINEMDANTDYLFRLERGSVPSTDPLSNEKHIAMYYTSDGSAAHEITHGGQIMKGEYGFIKNSEGAFMPDSRYTGNINMEIDAYKAQYAYDGRIQVPKVSMTHLSGVNASNTITIKRMNQITPGFIRSIAQGVGRLGTKPLYSWYRNN